MSTKKPFIVLGGCGAIGRVIVRDLFEFNKSAHIVIADLDENRATADARRYRSRRVTAAAVNADKVASISASLAKGGVAVNCTSHDFNLKVMKACLQAGCHYLDLGGLFLWTRKQLRLNRAFKNAGLTAVLGMGCAPGITNLLALYGARWFERLDAIRIRVGGIDFNPSSAPFAFPYSAKTIMEEMTLTPWKFANGKFVEAAPRTGWEEVDFGDPVGHVWTVLTRHSEVATLPLTLRRKGVKFVDFKVGFDRDFVRELMRRVRSGWTVSEFAALLAPRDEPDDYEISRVALEGVGSGDRKKSRLLIECHASSNAAWHASAGDIDTGCPASIVAQMIAAGSITERGVFAPESIVPLQPFFDECGRRGMRVALNTKA